MYKLTDIEIERSIDSGGIPAIELTMKMPQIHCGKRRTEKRFNNFYMHIADKVEKRAKKRLLKSATEDLNSALEQSKPFNPYRIKMTYTAGRDDENTDLIKITRRIYFKGHKGIEKERLLIDDWSLKSGITEKTYWETPDYSLLV